MKTKRKRAIELDDPVAELKRCRKSHDAMAQFLLRLLKFSDKKGMAKREPVVEKHYQKALKLLHQAGINYEPPRI